MEGLSGDALWISVLVLQNIQPFISGIVSNGVIIINTNILAYKSKSTGIKYH